MKNTKISLLYLKPALAEAFTFGHQSFLFSFFLSYISIATVDMETPSIFQAVHYHWKTSFVRSQGGLQMKKIRWLYLQFNSLFYFSDDLRENSAEDEATTMTSTLSRKGPSERVSLLFPEWQDRYFANDYWDWDSLNGLKTSIYSSCGKKIQYF